MVLRSSARVSGGGEHQSLKTVEARIDGLCGPEGGHHQDALRRRQRHDPEVGQCRQAHAWTSDRGPPLYLRDAKAVKGIDGSPTASGSPWMPRHRATQAEERECDLDAGARGGDVHLRQFGAGLHHRPVLPAARGCLSDGDDAADRSGPPAEDADRPGGAGDQAGAGSGEPQPQDAGRRWRHDWPRHRHRHERAGRATEHGRSR